MSLVKAEVLNCKKNLSSGRARGKDVGLCNQQRAIDS